MFDLSALPPLPPGAVGWQVYGPCGGLIEVVLDDDRVTPLAETFAEDVAAFVAGTDGQPGSAP